MGSIIGGVIGGLGSLFGGQSTKSGDQQAAQQSLTGYNYLTGSQAQDAYIGNGQTQSTAATSNVNNNESNYQGYNANASAANSAEAQLTGVQPLQAGTSNAFNNYLNSTGYQFQQQQGTAALTGSAAARGILNSGATAKALTNYGQNLASTTFNNYLGQLSGVQTQSANNAQQQIGNENTIAGTGQTALGQIGTAGTQGGASASQATQAGAAANGNGIATAAGSVGGQSSNILNTMGIGGTAQNFFGSL